jgi:hypothetical protein
MSDGGRRFPTPQPVGKRWPGRRVRFRGAPDQAVFWGGLLANDVDLINTNGLEGAQKLLFKP